MQQDGLGTLSREELAAIELLVLDVDGVMTDGGVYYTENGNPLLRFSILDGMGIVLAQRAGIQVAIMTTSSGGVIEQRGRRLGVKHMRMGVLTKGLELPKLLADAGVAAQATAYLSDDINDYNAFIQCGLPIAVSNAHSRIKGAARMVTKAPGGNGAVREVCDMLIDARGLDQVTLWENGEAPPQGKW